MDINQLRVLIVYPNLSMMLTPSCAVGIFTRILKQKGYVVELFDCTPYDSNLEFLVEPLPVTRAKTLLNSRSFDSAALFGEAKINLSDDYGYIKEIIGIKWNVTCNESFYNEIHVVLY